MRKRYSGSFFLLLALLATSAQAQNSYNVWTAERPAAVTPRARRAPKVEPKPTPTLKENPAPAPAVAPAPVVAPAPAEKPKSVVVLPAPGEPLVKQSRLLKRGLTERIRNHQALPEDNVSMEFFSNNSQYPPLALQAGAQGKVVIKLQIDPEGVVQKTSIVAMEPKLVPGRTTMVPVSAMQALADEAQRVFRMLRFEPATKGSSEELTAGFSLN